MSIGENNTTSKCLISSHRLNRIVLSLFLCLSILPVGAQKRDTLSFPTIQSFSDSGVILDRAHSIKTHYYRVQVCGADTIELKLGKFRLTGKARIEISYEKGMQSGILLTPTGGIDSAVANTWQDSLLTIPGFGFYLKISGFDYSKDSLLIFSWTTTSRQTIGPLKLKISSNPFSGRGVGLFVPVTFEATWDRQGPDFFEYSFDGSSYITDRIITHAFTSEGTYFVEAHVSSCGISDSVRLSFDVFTPNITADVAINIQYVDTLKSGFQTVQLTAESTTANSYEWSIYPLSYKYISGSKNSKSLVINFDTDSCYTLVLKSWNSANENVTSASDTVHHFYCGKRIRTFRKSIRKPIRLKFYHDADSNGIYDPKTDGLMVNQRFSLGSGLYATTGRTGVYNLNFSPGIIIIPVPDTLKWKLSKGQPQAILLDTAVIRNELLIGYTIIRSKTDFLDISSSSGSQTLRNGFRGSINFEIENKGNIHHDSVGVEITTQDSIFKPEFIVGNKTYQYASGHKFKLWITTGPYSISYVRLVFNHSPTDSIYFNVSLSAFAKDKMGDRDSSDNRLKVRLRIVRAKDPNDISVNPSGGFDRAESLLTYHVRFQNTGNYFASRVVVVDTLSEQLDLTSFRLINTSHDGYAMLKGRVLSFIFDDIYLPDSGSDNEGSQGFIIFNIRPVKLLKPYDTIKNLVDIYFDYEKPVRTNTAICFWKCPPRIVLFGSGFISMNSCDTFKDPGYIASDTIDGNLTHQVKIKGSVRTGIAGKYELQYLAVNSHGDTGRSSRIVEIRDTVRPHIVFRGRPVSDHMTVQYQVNRPFIDSVRATDNCSGNVGVTAIPGGGGAVNTAVIGEYPVTYYASDTNGNQAYENGYTIIYRVNDYISPNIYWNQPDTICHQVNTPFSPPEILYSDNYYSQKELQLRIKHDVNTGNKGIYPLEYKVTDGSGNYAIKTIWIRVDDCVTLNLNQHSEQSVISLFPNPAREHFQISGLTTGEFAQILILNPSGQVVKNTISLNTEGSMDVMINELPVGLYTVIVLRNTATQYIKLSIVR